MGAEYRREAERRIRVGFILSALGLFIFFFAPMTCSPGFGGPLMLFAFPLVVGGTAYWFYGFGSYARAKGYSQLVGILGIFNILGLIFLMVLPERRRPGTEAQQSTGLSSISYSHPAVSARPSAQAAASIVGAEARLKAGLKIVLGMFLATMATIIVNATQSSLVLVAVPMSIGGVVFWFWGFGSYAKSKGYSPVIGALGIFNLIGLVILLVLPEQHKEASGIQQSAGS